VHENIRAVVLLDKTKPLRIIEPFHLAFCHCLYSFSIPEPGACVGRATFPSQQKIHTFRSEPVWTGCWFAVVMAAERLRNHA
jgi:hypothetical protein